MYHVVVTFLYDALFYPTMYEPTTTRALDDIAMRGGYSAIEWKKVRVEEARLTRYTISPDGEFEIDLLGIVGLARVVFAIPPEKGEMSDERMRIEQGLSSYRMLSGLSRRFEPPHPKDWRADIPIVVEGQIVPSGNPYNGLIFIAPDRIIMGNQVVYERSDAP